MSKVKHTPANAHLIAAAPELLEALEALLPMAEWWWEGSEGRDKSQGIPGQCSQARAAIAKARGQ